MNPAWLPIILAIIDKLAPFIGEKLREWFKAQMLIEAGRLGVPQADIGKSSDRVIRAVYDGLWWFQFGRVRFVKKALGVVPVAMMSGGDLTPPEAEVIRSAAAGVS